MCFFCWTDLLKSQARPCWGRACARGATPVKRLYRFKKSPENCSRRSELPASLVSGTAVTCLYPLPVNSGILAAVTDFRVHLAARRSIRGYCARGFSPVPALWGACTTLTRPRHSLCYSISVNYRRVREFVKRIGEKTGVNSRQWSTGKERVRDDEKDGRDHASGQHYRQTAFVPKFHCDGMTRSLG